MAIKVLNQGRDALEPGDDPLEVVDHLLYGLGRSRPSLFVHVASTPAQRHASKGMSTSLARLIVGHG